MEVTVSSPGRLDMMGGVGDYSGGLVLEVATTVATTVTASLAARGGAAEAAVSVTSEPFGTVTLPLLPLLAGAVDYSAVRSFLSRSDVAAPPWARYVYGSIAAFVKETGWAPTAGHDLHLRVSSTVPASQGVSSSASIECAVLRALDALAATHLDSKRIAHLGQVSRQSCMRALGPALSHTQPPICMHTHTPTHMYACTHAHVCAQAAENHVVGAPCGLMDQLSSMLGVAGRVLPILCRPDTTYPVIPLPPDVVLVGWPSGVKHDVGASPYLVARTATFMAKKMAEAVLGSGLAFVTDLSPSQLSRDVLPHLLATISGRDFLARYGGVDDPLSRIDADTVYAVAASIRFPVDETFRCRIASSLLAMLADGSVATGSERYHAALRQLGELMLQTHEGYSSIGLGCAETDAMIRTLMRVSKPTAAAGGEIYGARVSGGGSGGTIAVLCDREALPRVQALADAAEHLAAEERAAHVAAGGKVLLIV